MIFVLQLVIRGIKTVLIPILVGLLSGLLIRNNVDIYRVLILPPFALPGNYFSVVWGVLYTVMGISLFFYKQANSGLQTEKNNGITLFFIQLFLCFLWPIVFFNLKLWLVAFLLLLLQFAFVASTVTAFYRASRISGVLLLPYLFFLVYAGYLNFAIYLLNM